MKRGITSIKIINNYYVNIIKSLNSPKWNPIKN